MPRGKTSIVWDHFSQPDAQNLVVCQICKAALAYCNSTGSLIKHLKFKHPLLWPSMVAAHGVLREAGYTGSLSPIPPPKIIKLDPEASIDTNLAVSRPFQLPEVPAFTTSSSTENNTVVSANGSTFVVQLNNGLFEMLSKAIVSDLRPVKFVSQPGIRNLIQSLSPACTFPSVSEISEFLKLKYLGAKSTLLYKISDAIEKDCRFAVTCWFRQSVEDDWFVTVGIRYITNEWQAEYFALETHALLSESKSIESLVVATLESFNLPNSLVQGFILGYGTATDMPKFKDSFESNAVTCIADKLETVIRESLNESHAVVMAIATAKQMMTAIKTQASCSQVLKSMRQNVHNWPLESCKSWIGMYNLLECFLSHQEQIVSGFVQHKGLTENDWDLIRQLFDLLKPFKAAVDFLSTCRFCPVSACPLILAGLERFTRGEKRGEKQGGQDEIKSEEICHQEIDVVRIAFHQRLVELAQFESCDTVTMATALDPRFCKLKHLKRTDRNTVHEALSTLCSSYASPSPAYRSPSPADSSVLGNLLGLESSDLCVWSDSSDDEEGIINEEVARYFRTSSANKDTDPLKWWQAKENAYPVLARLARQYLCMPATVADSSRVFSATDGAIEVEAENMDVVVFLNENRSLLDDCGLSSTTTNDPLFLSTEFATTINNTIV